jgi:hypothetical protein
METSKGESTTFSEIEQSIIKIRATLSVPHITWQGRTWCYTELQTNLCTIINAYQSLMAKRSAKRQTKSADTTLESIKELGDKLWEKEPQEVRVKAKTIPECLLLVQGILQLPNLVSEDFMLCRRYLYQATLLLALQYREGITTGNDALIEQLSAVHEQIQEQERTMVHQRKISLQR